MANHDNLLSKNEDNPDRKVTSRFFDDNYGVLPKNLNIRNTSIDLLLEMHSLNNKLREIKFSKPVEFVYNPTEYAFDMYKQYVHNYCSGFKDILYLGMNPGPWGMSQTGIPFGEVSVVKNWFKINGLIQKPPKECAARPVAGLECHRSEISGKRFWSLFQELCGEPEAFFKDSFVHNYCPVQLMTCTGKNITPADLKSAEANALYETCDESLRNVVKLFGVKLLVGVGKFAETRANKALKDYILENSIKVVSIPHPSPRSVGNTNWNPKAIQALIDLDIMKYYR